MAKLYAKIIPVAVFDISSGSVAGAHTLVPQSIGVATKVSVLTSTRLFSEPQEYLSVERFVESTAKQLDKVITTLKKQDNHIPEYIQVLLASPWFVSQTRTITYSKSTDFICNQKLIDSLIEKEIDYVLKNEMEQFGSMGSDALIVEKQISSIKLNGYNTTEPLDKKVQNLEISLVITVSPKAIIEKFKEKLQKSYAGAQISFTTSPYATFVVARDFLQAPNEFMIIDIGEEVTDIAYVKNDLFLYQHSFPVGIYELYRTISKDGHGSIEESQALIEAFRINKLSATMTKNIQKGLNTFGKLWQRTLQECIDANQYTIKIPATSYSISDYRFNTFFETLLKNDPFLGQLLATTNYTLTPIATESLLKHASSSTPDRLDETVLVAALFASRLL